jgi:hypothetical protein
MAFFNVHSPIYVAEFRKAAHAVQLEQLVFTRVSVGQESRRGNNELTISGQAVPELSEKPS